MSNEFPQGAPSTPPTPVYETVPPTSPPPVAPVREPGAPVLARPRRSPLRLILEVAGAVVIALLFFLVGFGVGHVSGAHGNNVRGGYSSNQQFQGPGQGLGHQRPGGTGTQQGGTGTQQGGTGTQQVAPGAGQGTQQGGLPQPSAGTQTAPSAPAAAQS